VSLGLIFSNILSRISFRVWDLTILTRRDVR